MKALLALIKKLYGSKALSKTIGTRTNVITLPDKDTKRFVTNELNIDAASDAAVKKAYEDVEKLIPDIPKMNDQEILTFTGNLRRLDQRLNPPSAEVIEFGTKQPVSPTGIKQLAAESGQMSPPGTLMGDLESRINQLRASGKKLEDITKGKGMTLDDLLQDPTRSGGPLDPKVGIVRTAAREILEKNLKAGKIDIPDEAAKDAILKSYQGGTDPIDVLRKTYGEGVLEQLDDIADELNRAKDYKDIQKILQREKLFDATPKKTYGYDEGVYSDEEMAKILSEASEEPKVISADSDEGKKITEALIGKPKAKVTELLTAEKIIADMNKMDPMDAMYEANKVLKKEGKYKDLSGDDVDRIMKETEDNIFQRNIPEEPEEFATGGRVGFAEGGSKGLNYLMGLPAPRTNFADGSNYEFIKTLPKSLSDAINKFGFEAVMGKDGGETGGTIPGKYTPYYSAIEAESGGGTGLKEEYLRILEAGPPEPTTPTPTSTPAEEMKETYTANVTPSNLYPNNPFYSSPVRTLYPNNPFYSYYSSEEEEDDAYDQYMKNLGYQSGGRVEMAGGGITALKALLKFFAEQKGKKGSDMLKEINPKRLGFLQNMLRKSDKEMLDANRQEYLENLSDIIKSDKKLLDRIKEMPEEARDTFFTMANEGGNRGRLDVYRDPNFNIEDAISEIEQMKKNLKFKDVPEKEVKRQMNASGGVAYLMGL